MFISVFIKYFMSLKKKIVNHWDYPGYDPGFGILGKFYPKKYIYKSKSVKK